MGRHTSPELVDAVDLRQRVGGTARALHLRGPRRRVEGQARQAGGEPDWFHYELLDDFRAATEKEFLRRKLLENHGNIKRTADRIDLQRSNLYKKLERYGLK